MTDNNFEITRTTKKGYTKQPNAILRDSELTSDAKVVIYFLLSISKGFHITVKGIANSIQMSDTKVSRAVELLQKTGYISLIKVKNGTKYGGYKWLISDVSGTFRDGKIQSAENRISDAHVSENLISENHTSENRILENHILKSADIYQITNNEQLNINKTNEEKLIEEEREYEGTTPTFTPINQSGERLLSSAEVNINQAFYKFCEVYPRLGDRSIVQKEFFAIPDINNICWLIVSSVEWFEKNKRWDDWQTGQKNKYCPQAAKFLKRGDWQEYLKSGRTISFEERVDAILPVEED